MSARKRIAADERDREGDSEGDPTPAVTSAPAKKQKAPVEQKRKMVARSETEAEERTVPGKKKRKSEVTASTAAEEAQVARVFVPVRKAEAKKSRARCVSSYLPNYRS